MIVNREHLETLKMADLKRLVLEAGGDPSQPSETKEALIERILLIAATEPKLEEKTEDVSNEVKKPVKACCTIQQVKDAMAPYILRGMKVFYDKESNSWLFRVQIKSYTVRDSNSGEIRVIERWRDDSGTLEQPLATIKRCASVLMQSAVMPVVAEVPFNPAEKYEAIA